MTRIPADRPAADCPEALGADDLDAATGGIIAVLIGYQSSGPLPLAAPSVSLSPEAPPALRPFGFA